MFIATLIAPERLTQGDISAVRDALMDAGCQPLEVTWLEAEIAADIGFARDLDVARAALGNVERNFDVIAQEAASRRKKLLVADMDSTMITVECLDELADYVGFKAQVSDITERAMRGEMDFIAALDERVRLLNGLRAEIVTKCYEDRVRISTGARRLVRTMKADGGRCVLVSGGFSSFADRVAGEIGFDRAVSNVLGVEDGLLSGFVERPIVDSDTKQRILVEETADLGLKPSDTLALGDGANDKALIETAGLGIAYRGKPLLREAADGCLDHADLSALLYVQGIARADWVES